MTAQRGDQEDTGIANRPTNEGSGVPAVVTVAFLAMLGVLPILGHGCHRGDHDFEPVAVPVDPRAIPLEPPR